MLKSFSIKNLQLFAGACARLDEPTAICTLVVEGELDDWPAKEGLLRHAISQFWPSEPIPGLSYDDWPDALLLDQSTNTLATWVVALTIACQRLARDPVGWGRVVTQKDNIAELALPYARESVLREALTWALRWIAHWLSPKHADKANQLTLEFEEWLNKVQTGGLVPNSLRFALAARQRGIPVCKIGSSMIQLGWGASAIRMESSFTSTTSVIGTRIARNKNLTSKLLAQGGLPVPTSTIVATFDNAQKVAMQLGWPVVIKPSNQDGGAGVVPDIRNEKMLQNAYAAAAKLSPNAVIVEKHVDGDDHRMLVVNGKLVMSTRRIPGGVTGDGIHTIAQLIDAVNADPRRGTGKRSLLIALTLDDEARTLLCEQGHSEYTVLQSGQFIRLRRTANLSTGGTPEDVSHIVHPDNRLVAERAARLVGLDIAGVDFLCPDISRSWREVGGAICEVNAQPGFRPHWLGDPTRDINGEIVDAMFAGKDARIPVTAIAGVGNKTVTGHLLHRIWMTAGYNAAILATDGLWIGNDLLSTDNLSSYRGGEAVLSDSAVETLIIELSRKDLLQFGHPCDRYAVAALLTTQDPQTNVGKSNPTEAIAHLNAELLERTTDGVVISADDPLCLALLPHVRTSRHILVTQHHNLAVLNVHLANHGVAVFIKEHLGKRWIMYAQGTTRIPCIELSNIATDIEGLPPFNNTEVLFAVALACAHGIEIETIRKALHTSACANHDRLTMVS